MCPPPSPAGCHDRAVLLYEYVGKRIVDLQHTEVPDAYRGRGIAKHLAKVGRWGWGGTPAQRKPWPWWLTAACFLAKVQMGAHLANRLQLGDCQGACVPYSWLLSGWWQWFWAQAPGSAPLSLQGH